MGRFYRRVATPLLADRNKSKVFLLTVGGATLMACTLFATKAVRVKLLPFDNKSEIQVVVDLPRGASVEDTDRVLTAAAERLKDLAELTSIQAYAGTAAPFNFNGLVRHYFFRQGPEQGELAINLKPKHDRSRASHAIALDIRKRLTGLASPEGTAVKVVEVPPGPPVMSTLLAEIYGPDPETRRALAGKVRKPSRLSISSSTSTTASMRRRSDSGSPSTRTGARVPRGRAGRLRYDRRPYRRRADRFLAARAGPEAHRHPVALPRAQQAPSERMLSTPLPAGGTVRQGNNVRARRCRQAQARTGLLPDLSPQRPVCRDGERGGRRPLRGAHLRHVRRGGRDQQAGLGQSRRADHRFPRTAGRRC